MFLVQPHPNTYTPRSGYYPLKREGGKKRTRDRNERGFVRVLMGHPNRGDHAGEPKRDRHYPSPLHAAALNSRRDLKHRAKRGHEQRHHEHARILV